MENVLKVEFSFFAGKKKTISPNAYTRSKSFGRFEWKLFRRSESFFSLVGYFGFAWQTVGIYKLYTELSWR
jgi:hypothetical protein